MTIRTFVINLDKRKDRKRHALRVFRGRGVFDVSIFNAIEGSPGSLGLWHSMRAIVERAIIDNLDMVLICEDDHIFTEHYSDDKLLGHIEEARALGAEILLGGLSGFQDCVLVSDTMIWVSSFSGAQFLIIFKSFFKTFLAIDLEAGEDIDRKLGDFSDYIFACFPFISVQKSFGYSDVTERNGQENVLSGYFEQSVVRIETLKEVEHSLLKYYK